MTANATHESCATSLRRATFCRGKINQHSGSLDAVKEHVILVSLEWPSPLNFFKDPALTEEEERLLENFSCLKARCASRTPPSRWTANF